MSILSVKKGSADLPKLPQGFEAGKDLGKERPPGLLLILLSGSQSKEESEQGGQDCRAA